MITDNGQVYILDLAIHTVKQPDGRRQIYTFDGKGKILGEVIMLNYSSLYLFLPPLFLSGISHNFYMSVVTTRFWSWGIGSMKISINVRLE